MALFFDQDWFDGKLRAKGKTRDDVAASLRLARSEVDEIFKDQREMSPNEVTMLARLLGEPLTDVVSRAGIATPMPAAPAAQNDSAAVLAKLGDIDQRLVRIERAIADLQSLIIATRPQVQD
jgi:hypothetical protein